MTTENALFNEKKHHIRACGTGTIFFTIGVLLSYGLLVFFDGLVGRTWALLILSFPFLIVSLSPVMGYGWYMERAKQKHCEFYGHNFAGKNEVKWCTICGKRNMNYEEIIANKIAL